MNSIKFVISCLAIITLSSCSKEQKGKFIVVKNTSAIERHFETVELTKEFLKVKDLTNLGIKDVVSNELLVTQLVDLDGDGVMDQLLFQPNLVASSDKKYEIVQISEAENPKAEDLCYSRFVPERTDDYTWENNKVAFRVFGPTAQKMFEDGTHGGTLSSGVDAWLKRVEHPIINNWYKKETETKGTYHEDTGEGLDNFHVGVSRGVGGIAAKIDSTYYYSKNYTKWRTITTGPIRTCFYLEYENWDADGNTIKESKIISLDLGQNLSKFDTSIEGVTSISAGLTLHEKDGEVYGNNNKGWVSYWQPHGDSEMGTAIVAVKDYFIDFETYDSDVKDLSNAYAHLNVIENQVIYYSGFAWKKSGQFNTKQDWGNYLNEFSQKINNPLVISLNK